MDASLRDSRAGGSVARTGGLRPWLVRHLQSFFFALGQLARSSGQTSLTASVIGIALSLPLGLFIGLENVLEVTDRWDGDAQVTLFLKRDVEDRRRDALLVDLRTRSEVLAVTAIAPDDALREYRTVTGSSEVFDALGDENPLPTVVVLEVGDTVAAQRLADQLGRAAEVELVQFDLRWVKRLEAMTIIARRTLWMVGAVLAAGVVLIVGNTIRLAIDNRRSEIEIAKLFGATDAFVRRPFLYTGALFGALGATLAWLIVYLGISALSEPIAQLSALYGSEFQLSGWGLDGLGVMLGLGVGLGWIGAMVAVGRHLGAIQPR